ncbi:MarR family winged helix-turn-helix transcriptional regulator [Quadrisphaera sp. GCM10027208]|uniref:MarR family winged helix-turn-helix transcriptional regulator n=1 Tax=Quadrisphaera sp. GCM10027208 TaxID=3273423 RepID=UPI0036079198|nr:MarR family transcriptional regulator [Kineosporiaceae bacterium SCSIO 59966]
MVRWLDAEEQRVWRAFLEADQRLWDRLSRELDERSGLSLPEYEILVRLSEVPERALRMSQLADRLVHSRSRLTHTARRMEQRGLVRREACPGDRRGVLCVMTDAGWDELVAAAPVHVEGVRSHLFDQMTPEEVAAFGSAMAKVAAHLRET